jgi:hypothetical protein
LSAEHYPVDSKKERIKLNGISYTKDDTVNKKKRFKIKNQAEIRRRLKI